MAKIIEHHYVEICRIHINDKVDLFFGKSPHHEGTENNLQLLRFSFYHLTIILE